MLFHSVGNDNSDGSQLLVIEDGAAGEHRPCGEAARDHFQVAQAGTPEIGVREPVVIEPLRQPFQHLDPFRNLFRARSRVARSGCSSLVVSASQAASGRILDLRRATQLVSCFPCWRYLLKVRGLDLNQHPLGRTEVLA